MTADDGMLEPSAVADPHSYFAALRAERPVYWNERYRAWIVTGYDDVSASFRDPRLSSDRITPLLEKWRARSNTDPLFLEALEQLAGWMVFKDGGDHTRLRRLVYKAFTPRMIEAMRSDIAAVAHGLLDEMSGHAEVDLIREFAFPLPAIVIAGMLGVPPEDRDRFKDWSDEITSLVFGGLDDPDRYQRAGSGMDSLVKYLSKLVAHYRADPANNLLSALIRARDEDDTLSESEILSTCVLLLFGGHETTTNLIGNGLLALLRNPRQRELLEGNPHLIDRAVEEFLRYDGPAKTVVRVAAADLQIGGGRISAGQRVYLAPSAANRDPAVFDRPDELDIRRESNQHLGFGMGPHYCLGAALARLEGAEAIGSVLARFPQLHLADQELSWHPVLLSRGLTALPVSLCHD
jgi:cytochrome P450